MSTSSQRSRDEAMRQVSMDREKQEADLIDKYKLLCDLMRRQLDRQHHINGIGRLVWRQFEAGEQAIFAELKKINGRRQMMMNNAISSERRALMESFEQAMFKPMPASKAAVETLEKFVMDDKHGSSSSSSGSNSMCVICIEEILNGDEVTRMSCSHIYHGDCIGKWLNQWGHTCPICKSELPKAE